MSDKNEFSQLSEPLNARVPSNGENYLYFGGTAYLGIPQNEDFLKLYIDGIQKFGLNNGTSRGNNVQLAIYDEVEEYAAKRYGTESAMITSSGFLAAQIVVKQLVNFGETRYAPATHPALWLNQAPTTKGSFNDWALQIVEEINSSSQKNWLLISNSMNNLCPEIYDFSFVKKISSNKELILLVDDSHGIGVNNDGLTALKIIPSQENVKVLIVASMAKALGVDAGIVMGSEKLIDLFKDSNAFLGASPPAAAGLYAFMQGEKIYAAQLKKLRENTLSLSAELRGNADWYFIPDFPVFFSKNADISARLLKHQILVSSFPYPDKDGATVNRIVLSSWHTKNDIHQLITSLS